MKLTSLSRYQAFSWHMAYSFALFLILLTCIFQFWYPGLLFQTGDGWKAIGLIIGVDLVLGPLLTLLIFNPQKASLKMDVGVILVIQLAALIYGAGVIYETRPVALSFTNKSFMTIYANSPLGKALSESEQHNEKLYFYDFDVTPNTSDLTIDGLKPYSDHSTKISGLHTPYITNLDNGKTSVAIDPIIGKKHYLIIESASGDILTYTTEAPAVTNP